MTTTIMNKRGLPEEEIEPTQHRAGVYWKEFDLHFPALSAEPQKAIIIASTHLDTGLVSSKD